MALANQVDHKFAISVLQVTLVTADVLSQLIAKSVSQENTAALKPTHVLIVCQESTAALALNFVLTARRATRRWLAKHSASAVWTALILMLVFKSASIVKAADTSTMKRNPLVEMHSVACVRKDGLPKIKPNLRNVFLARRENLPGEMSKRCAICVGLDNLQTTRLVNHDAFCVILVSSCQKKVKLNVYLVKVDDTLIPLDLLVVSFVRLVHLAWLDLPHAKRARKAGTRSTVKEAELVFRVLLESVVKVDWVDRICWIKRLILTLMIEPATSMGTREHN